MNALAKFKSVLSVKNVGIALTPVAMVATGAFVMNQSTAAFTAETYTGAETWDAGTVVLSNDHATALFTPKGIAPGYSESHCITVTSGSDIPVNLKMYSKNLIAGDLANNMLLSIEEGSGGVNNDGVNGAPGSCTGFVSSSSAFSGTLASFGLKTDFASGVAASVVTPNQTKQYRITANLPSSTSNALQGTKTGLSFVWEAQS